MTVMRIPAVPLSPGYTRPPPSNLVSVTIRRTMDVDMADATAQAQTQPTATISLRGGQGSDHLDDDDEEREASALQPLPPPPPPPPPPSSSSSSSSSLSAPPSSSHHPALAWWRPLVNCKKLGNMPDYSAVWLLGNDHVLKYGPDVSLQEAAMMMFVRSHTNVPVPKIEKFGRHPDSGHAYILMRRVEGTPLDQAWDSFDSNQLDCIALQLRQYYASLRGQRRPHIGSYEMIDAAQGSRESEDASALTQPGSSWTLHRSGVTDNFFPATTTTTRTGAAPPGSPGSHFFDHEGSFLHALASTVAARDSTVWNNQVVCQMLRTMPMVTEQQHQRPYSFALTHGELAPKNVLIDEATGRVTAVLDWSQAGFYPDYWEYVKAHWAEMEDRCFLRDGRLQMILPESYPMQLAIMLHARDIIW